MVRKIDLSRRNLLAALGTIGAASALGGAGTLALFRDDEVFEGNELVAGELDLLIDWQQTYHGPLTSSAYGTAGYPFVNAYPDDDGDGVQDDVPQDFEIWAEGEGFDLDDPESRKDAITEFKEYFEDASDLTAPLIQLHDVKPGDKGEITFSLHLFDNDGYIRMFGAETLDAENGQNEPELETEGKDTDGDGELDDEILVTVWYDDGDNVLESDETVILEGVSLSDALEQLSAGVPLDPAIYEDEPVAIPVSACAQTTYDSLHKTGDTVTVGGESVEIANNPKCTDFGYDQALKIGPDEDDGELPGDGNSQTYATPYGDLTVTQTDTEEGETITWESDGFCVSKVVVKGGNEGANVYSYDNDDGDDDFDNDQNPALSTGENRALHTPTFQEISHVSFCVGDPGQPPNGDYGCFEACNTYHIGFEWELPADVGNEVQTDTVGFSLGFEAEQCRHNTTPFATRE
ncbi:SipW-dependent-type signal peptide-containing protein [Halobacteriaceae archaeon GCM10025711]